MTRPSRMPQPRCRFQSRDIARLGPENAARLRVRMERGENHDLALALSKRVNGIHYSRISGVGAVDQISLQALIHGELKRIEAGHVFEEPLVRGPRQREE